MKPMTVTRPAMPLGRGFDLTAIWALFVLTLRQYIRGRKLLILSLLFLLPSALALVVRFMEHPPKPAEVEFYFVFYLIPHALMTLTALLYSAGIIQDEVEEQTLTYLLCRPLPRWTIYITKLTVAFSITATLTGVFTVLTLTVIHWNTPELWGDILPERALRIVGLMTLAQACYCAGFGLLGMLTRWSLILGLAYIVAFEGLMASIPTVARQLTVNFYFRVLSLRWLKPVGSEEWEIDLSKAPGTRACILTMLGVSAALAMLGAVLMMRREFRVKTPEGN